MSSEITEGMELGLTPDQIAAARAKRDRQLANLRRGNVRSAGEMQAAQKYSRTTTEETISGEPDSGAMALRIEAQKYFTAIRFRRTVLKPLAKSAKGGDTSAAKLIIELLIGKAPIAPDMGMKLKSRSISESWDRLVKQVGSPAQVLSPPTPDELLADERPNPSPASLDYEGDRAIEQAGSPVLALPTEVHPGQEHAGGGEQGGANRLHLRPELQELQEEGVRESQAEDPGNLRVQEP